MVYKSRLKAALIVPKLIDLSGAINLKETLPLEMGQKIKSQESRGSHFWGLK